MEASQAGPQEMAPGNEPADRQPTAPAPAQEAQTPAPDFGALQSQLSELAPSLDALRGTLEETRTAQLQEQQPEAPPEAGPPDLGFLSPEQPEYDPNQAAELLGKVIQDNVQSQLQSATGPLQEQIADMRLEQEAGELAREFPELEGNNEAIEKVFADAETYAQRINQPELSSSVPFVRLVYMAGRAAEMSNDEAQPDVRTATLQGAGGASPVAPGGARMEDALLTGARRNPLPFS